MPLDAQIEAILFWRGEAISLKKLGEILEKPVEEIQAALQTLDEKLQDRGLELVYNEDEVMLGTRATLSPLIEKLRKEELVRDSGKAGLETLPIILYRGPVSRRDIDYIRGVNSQFILRNLLVRGLIEKVVNPQDERSFLYKPTFELLTHLGVSKIDELPEFADVRKELEAHKESKQEPQASEVQESHES